MIHDGLSSSVACEIFRDQGFRPCFLLNWQVDSLAVSHQGSPIHLFSDGHVGCFYLLSLVSSAGGHML